MRENSHITTDILDWSREVQYRHDAPIDPAVFESKVFAFGPVVLYNDRAICMESRLAPLPLLEETVRSTTILYQILGPRVPRGAYAIRGYWGPLDSPTETGDISCSN